MGTTQRSREAADFYQKACAGGNAKGCFNLAVMYDNGEGVSQDFVRAKELYQQTCEQGAQKGCFNLGLLYEYGKGIPKDIPEAMSLYQKSCERGEAAGCLHLGWHHERLAVHSKKSDATTFYQQACDLQSTEGCLALQNLEQSTDWSTVKYGNIDREYTEGMSFATGAQIYRPYSSRALFMRYPDERIIPDWYLLPGIYVEGNYFAKSALRFRGRFGMASSRLSISDSIEHARILRGSSLQGTVDKLFLYPNPLQITLGSGIDVHFSRASKGIVEINSMGNPVLGSTENLFAKSVSVFAQAGVVYHFNHFGVEVGSNIPLVGFSNYGFSMASLLHVGLLFPL